MKPRRGSGSRRHLLVFEKLTETKDESTGSVTESWQKQFTMYGEIVSGKSMEVFESQRRNAISTWPQYVPTENYVFRVPHKNGIDPLIHRIKFDGKQFDIFPPVRDNNGNDMLIQAIYHAN